MVKSLGNFSSDTSSYVEQIREIFKEGEQKVEGFQVNYFLADFTLSFLHSGPLQTHLDKHDFRIKNDFEDRLARIEDVYKNKETFMIGHGFSGKREMLDFI